MGLKAQIQGFTLLETLVSLIIVGMGMMAVNAQLNRYVLSTNFIEEKNMASWVASNQVTLMSISPQWAPLGESEIDIENYAGRNWVLEIEVSETPVTNLRRADIHVYLSNNRDRLIHTISALLEPPPPENFTPTSWATTSITETSP
ncbi:MAG: type II secretion system protein GspI [Rhodospirillaceae bacterium]|nr:type II secretion system protein GspI [Rhodospirillaceae bacterium]|tara:strand:- start:1117 stop:1554 length:438 start_codon:yes stop_codon:yes gene_type:complete